MARASLARRGALRVEVTCHVRRPIRAPGLAAWLSRVAPAAARGEVSVALVSDARIRALNRTYRGVNRVTDVLSFPADANPSEAAGPFTAFLGDIVIAVDVAARQAASGRQAFGAELRVLALHGLLHLLGYDHERDRGEMAELEARWRLRGGLKTGLIERAGQKRDRNGFPGASAAKTFVRPPLKGRRS